MKIKKTPVYQFEELSDHAKERAREWMRRGTCDDSYCYESTLEDFTTIAGYLGYEVKTDRVFFSGFSSQGDGACFEGTFRPENLKLDQLMAYAPHDKELARIGKELAGFIQDHPCWYATIKHVGHYSHKYETEFSCEELNGDDEDITDAQAEEEFIEMSRDLMEWLYRQLEREYEYQMSDEQIEETIRANEYEFTEDGTQF
jgi:hypothetical protein